MMSFRDHPFPEELYLLCMLHNIGATTSDRSLTLEEISRRVAMEPQKVMENLEKLIKNNYVNLNRSDDVKKYHVTIEGIVKVMSMYS